MAPYITMFDTKPPTSETSTAPSNEVPVETHTAQEVVSTLFGRGPVYTHGPSGLVFAKSDAETDHRQRPGP